MIFIHLVQYAKMIAMTVLVKTDQFVIILCQRKLKIIVSELLAPTVPVWVIGHDISGSIFMFFCGSICNIFCLA